MYGCATARSSLSSKELITVVRRDASNDSHGLALARGRFTCDRARDTNDHRRAQSQFPWRWSRRPALELYRVYETAGHLYRECVRRHYRSGSYNGLWCSRCQCCAIRNGRSKPHYCTGQQVRRRAIAPITLRSSVDHMAGGVSGIDRRSRCRPRPWPRQSHVAVDDLAIRDSADPGWLAGFMKWKIASSGQDGGPVFGIEPAAAKRVGSAKRCVTGIAVVG